MSTTAQVCRPASCLVGFRLTRVISTDRQSATDVNNYKGDWASRWNAVGRILAKNGPNTPEFFDSSDVCVLPNLVF